MKNNPHAKLLFLIVPVFAVFIFFLSTFSVFAQDSQITSVSIIVVCGDGLAEPLTGEVCDPGDSSKGIPADVNGLDCSAFDDSSGNPFTSGTLGCASDCSAYATTTCYSCGNNILESGNGYEQCDGNDFGGQTCIGLGFDSGNLICTVDCKVNTVNCVSDEIVYGGGGGGGSAGGNPKNPQGYKPGSDVAPGETKVTVRGSSYPESDVHILVDGKVIGIVRTDTKANFYFETDEVPAGVASFSFWSEDALGLKSTLMSLTFRVTSGAVTNISGVYISPTIDIDKNNVSKGEKIKIYGQSVPESEIKVHINSEQEFVEQASSTDKGNWELHFDTNPLEEDFHTAKALFQTKVSGNIIQSGFSKAVSFYVGKVGGEAVCAEADLNGDGRVNITDFSILLFYWGSNNECADQNQNGNVDLIDFSIMMFYWTG